MRTLLALPLAIIIAGCATSPGPSPDKTAPNGDIEAAWQLRQEKLAEFDTWGLDGRIAVSREDDAWHAGLEWRQIADAYQINLRGPFSQGSVELSGSSHSVVLRTSEEQAYTSGDPDALLHQHLGWRVPVKALRHWMIGLSQPEEPREIELDAAGRLAVLRQSGWEVNYLRYSEVGGRDLPAKVFMSNGELKVRVVVSRWRDRFDTPGAVSAAP